ncbi:hypothetical protein [Nitratifractor sp.]
MFTVEIKKECGCFRKSGLENHRRFGNKDEALMEAQRMVGYMNEKFCKKHEFRVVENDLAFHITVDERSRSGCCGGGHCS